MHCAVHRWSWHWNAVLLIVYRLVGLPMSRSGLSPAFWACVISQPHLQRQSPPGRPSCQTLQFNLPRTGYVLRNHPFQVKKYVYNLETSKTKKSVKPNLNSSYQKVFFPIKAQTPSCVQSWKLCFQLLLVAPLLAFCQLLGAVWPATMYFSSSSSVSYSESPSRYLFSSQNHWLPASWVSGYS